MDLKEYQPLAARTAPTHLSDEDRRLNCAMGLVGEFGELVDLLKKRRFHGHDVGDKLRDELSDVLWYLSESATIDGEQLEAAFIHDHLGLLWTARQVAQLACCIGVGLGTQNDAHRAVVASVVALVEECGYTLSEVLEANVAKLRKRYPDGYSSKASIERTS